MQCKGGKVVRKNEEVKKGKVLVYGKKNENLKMEKNEESKC